jgi:hypothetical protein
VLLTEAPWNHKVNRERMTQIMFETFTGKPCTSPSRPFLPCARRNGQQAASSPLATAGGTVTTYEGYAFSHAILRVDLAGRDVTEHRIKSSKSAGTSSQPPPSARSSGTANTIWATSL